MRYGRLKAALDHVEPADYHIMSGAVDKVKAAIEEEKKALEKKLWSRVVEQMVEDGASKKYEVGTVEKDFKNALHLSNVKR